MDPLVELRGTSRTAVINFLAWCEEHDLNPEYVRDQVEAKFNADGRYAQPAEIHSTGVLLCKGKWVADRSLESFLRSFMPAAKPVEEVTEFEILEDAEHDAEEEDHDL